METAEILNYVLAMFSTLVTVALTVVLRIVNKKFGIKTSDLVASFKKEK